MKNQNSFLTKIGEQNIILDWSEKDIALLTLLGAALSESQSFEVTVSFFLSAILAQNDSKLDFDDLMENHTSQTLGWLSNKLKKELENEKVSAAIDQARIKRNFLVHNILKKYRWPLMSEDDYLKCIIEINKIRKVISESEIEISRVLKDEKILELIILSEEDLVQLNSFKHD